MSLRSTHTTTYFTCRWLVVVLAIFLFTHVCILAAKAQELSEATQEPDGQAAMTEAAQEAERQAGVTEATQEPGGQAVTIETTQEPDDLQTITESGLQTNPIYESIFEELNLDEVERALQQQGIQTPMPITEMVKNRWRVTTNLCFLHCLRRSAAYFLVSCHRTKDFSWSW